MMRAKHDQRFQRLAVLLREKRITPNGFGALIKIAPEPRTANRDPEDPRCIPPLEWIKRRTPFEVALYLSFIEDDWIDAATRVYFARSDDGALKLGFSGDVRTRIRKLWRVRSGTRLITHVPGTRGLEGELKTRFRRERIEGEWFTAGGDLEATIGHLVALQQNAPGDEAPCPA